MRQPSHRRIEAALLATTAAGCLAPVCGALPGLRARSRVGLAAALVLSIGVTTLDIATLPWALMWWQGRSASACCAATVDLLALYRVRRLRPRGGGGVVVLAAAGTWIAVTLLMIERATMPRAAMSLGFPLRNGRYAIVHGGGPSTNAHSSATEQRYAYDIVRLEPIRGRATGVYPRRLDAYAIWGDVVSSPCDGTVHDVVDGHPDNSPPDRDAEQPAGNHVVVAHGDALVVVAHLQCGSVCVSKGQDVRIGQALGRVGNSGNSSEPHLHLHATRALDAGSPVPIAFEGLGRRLLFRNDVVLSTTETGALDAGASRTKPRVTRALTPMAWTAVALAVELAVLQVRGQMHSDRRSRLPRAYRQPTEGDGNA